MSDTKKTKKSSSSSKTTGDKGNKQPLTKINSSLFGRTMSVAKMGLNAGFRLAASKVSTQVSGKNKKEGFDNYLTGQAKYISQELGQLKGSLMKAGQMLSMYGEYFFPPQANDYLKKLQSDSPPVEWIVVKSYLENYLDSELIDELEIDPVSIGTASMGQVHKAVIKSTGEKIALKIQYPNLENAIDSDIKALKTLLNLSKLIPSGLDLDPVMEEIKSMLRQELNYELEADLTERYYSLLAGDPRYKAPRVFRRYSCQRVLATEFMEGLRADHALVQSLSQKRRDQLSINFLDLYFKEIFLWNFVQTDPHLGNYKIQIDAKGEDRIVLLDFGATREFSFPFMTYYRQMIKGSILKDETFFMAASKKLGFIKDSDSKDYIKTFVSFCYETTEPFSSTTESYDWKATDLPTRVVKNAMKFKNFDLRTPPKDILFLDRKTGGVFIFLSVLKANILARKIVDPYLEAIT